MEIKVGQVWQNDKEEKFYIKEVWNEYSVIDGKVFFVSLQNTDEYFAGEVGSCSLDLFVYQTKDLKLIAEDFSITEELDLELKIKSKINKINNYKTQIKDIQNKIDIIKQEIDKLYDKLKEINPDNNSIFKLSEFYFIDDLVQIGQRALKEVEQKREKRNTETIENAKHWFKITCPRCKTSFECCENGYGTHCYDYLTKDGKEIVGSLDTQTLECPICNKYFKDPTLKHEEDC